MNTTSHLIRGEDFITRAKRALYFRRARVLALRNKLAVATGLMLPNEKKLLGFKDLHRGKRCFIIGNGPSLNKIDLTLLKNEITFGVNAIYTNYERMQFYPTYYVLDDIFVAEDRKYEINNYRESVKFYGHVLSYTLDKDDKTILLNVIVDYNETPDFPKFSEDALYGIYVGGTVSYLCMQLAFYMGFTSVYLIGFDHNYVIPKTAVVYKTNKIMSTEDDQNHFSKDYFGKGKRWHDPRMDRLEKSYAKARLHFEKNGRNIFNATAGGNLEVFKRVNYSGLF